MRVVLVTPWFLGKRVSGAATYVKLLARGLVNHNVEVHVITQGMDAADKSYYQVNGIYLHLVGGTRNWLAFILKARSILKKLVDEEDFDVIHSIEVFSASATLFKNSIKLERIPIITTLTNLLLDEVKYRFYEELYNLISAPSFHVLETIYGIFSGIALGVLEFQVYNYSDHLIAPSSYIARKAESLYHVSRNKISLIPFAIEIEKFEKAYPSDIREKLGIQENPLVLYVGRLDPRKGVTYLLKAFYIVKKKIPRAKLLIIGEGSLKRHLIRLAIRLGIKEDVIFYGKVARDLLPSIYKIADVCVVPSIYEPFGLVAIEALASGTPVVASAVGGLIDIIKHYENGVLVKPGDVHDLAGTIIKLLSDRELLNNIRRKIKILLGQYDYKLIARKTIDLYEKLVQNNRL